MSAAAFDDLSREAKADAIERIEDMPYAFGVHIT